MVLLRADAKAPWMNRYGEAPRTLSGWRASRRANPAWKHLSRYGKLVSHIFHHLPLKTTTP